MTQARPHIAVCICTYKRLELLAKLLRELALQETNDLFSFSIVVADNDRERSAEATVAQFRQTGAVPITYCVQPRQNIALTRNEALKNAAGDFVAFIDDDQVPIKKWLLLLFTECQQRAVAGVLGPVKPYYDVKPPAWVVKGKFYDRPTYPTGLVIDWRKGRTGNVLFRRKIIEGLEQPFNPLFITGEDQDFFRRMIEQGHVFTWCDEAAAYEVVPPIRWNRRFMLKRALLRGKVSLQHPTSRFLELSKSFVAVAAYGVLLPVFFVLGQHLFMKYLIKLCDHLGRILTFCRISVGGENYVTEQ
jgi:glycosyltransferase involved in cell wall biosynthesis